MHFPGIKKNLKNTSYNIFLFKASLILLKSRYETTTNAEALFCIIYIFIIGPKK